jgi:hypothetical protein
MVCVGHEVQPDYADAEKMGQLDSETV